MAETPQTHKKHRPQGKKGHKVARGIGMTLLTLVLVGLISGGIVVGAFLIYVQEFIDPSIGEDLANVSQDLTTFIYYVDQDGKEVEMEQLYRTVNRVWTPITNIPQHLQEAFVAIEDERFMEHNGVDWKRTFLATVNFFIPIGNGNFGASTITQQLIKNLTGEDDITPKRKIQEIVRALNLESQYEKPEILESYLNTIFLSQGCYGVQTASQTYFGKDVSELSLAECASIAAITKYPTKFDPFKNPENNKERQEVILNKMCELGKISEAERDEAKAAKLVFHKEQTQAARASKQSYYVDQIINDVLSDLQKRKGYSKQFANDVLFSGGLKIYAAIDMDVQKAIDEVFLNEKNFPAVDTVEQPQASMVVMDPYTGRVLGLVGGRGEKMDDRGLNRATQTYRQPGSSIKPLGAYAPGIDLGVVTMGSVFDDAPFKVEEKWPNNYYSGYKGMMSVQRAVELSTNTVAVRALDAVTPAVAYQFMQDKFHITSLKPQDKYLSPLALGGLTKGLSVLEMTAAYQTFVNKGQYSVPFTYTKALDSKGEVILENKVETTPSMDEQTAFIMNQLLQSAVKNGTAAAAKIDNIATAGKTGTTNDDKDRWFVGYTPYYVASVWFGYDIPETIVVSGGNPALNLWKKVMVKLHENLEPREFFETSGVVQASYCLDSGKMPTELCKSDFRGGRIATAWYKEGTQPTEPCDVHTTVQLCGESMCLATEFCPKETLKPISLLNIRREFPYALSVADAQYTYLPLPDGFVPDPADNPVYLRMLTPGMNPGSSNVDNPVNTYCKLHTKDTANPAFQTVIAADGSVLLQDGTLWRPNGTLTHADGTVERQAGPILTPDSYTLRTDGTILFPDGSVRYPNGSITHPDGSITGPDGTVIPPPGGGDPEKPPVDPEPEKPDPEKPPVPDVNRPPSE